MRILIFVLGFILSALLAVLYFNRQLFFSVSENIPTNRVITSTVTPTPTVYLTTPPQSKIIPQQIQVFQAFNNCGPASLSMLLSYFNTNISQEIIGQQLRPYQNPQGDNDDKSVTLPELAGYAEQHNFITYHRPNGSLDMAKLLITHDIPFIVRTWLNPNEDIGHYRVVRGYDDTTQEFIQDDSYQGGNLRYSYTEFISMWQPFNYEFLIIVPLEQEEIVKTILGEDVSWEVAWQHALEKAKEEEQTNPQNPYPVFNQSVANYHLGRYEESIQKYEQIVSQLPNRMLWYQIEPIKSYFGAGDFETGFNVTNTILNNQNRAFSELYIARGMVYEQQGNIELARQEYQQAVFYNQNLKEAQDALARVSN